jgi:hypothetical protein
VKRKTISRRAHRDLTADSRRKTRTLRVSSGLTTRQAKLGKHEKHYLSPACPELDAGLPLVARDTAKRKVWTPIDTDSLKKGLGSPIVKTSELVSPLVEPHARQCFASAASFRGLRANTQKKPTHTKLAVLIALRHNPLSEQKAIPRYPLGMPNRIFDTREVTLIAQACPPLDGAGRTLRNEATAQNSQQRWLSATARARGR